MANEPIVRSVEEFRALYDSAEEDNETWRTTSIAAEVCIELLEHGFSPDTLLLNKKLPATVLQVLSTHPDPRIRSMVADKRSAGPLLQILASDPDVGVRLRVVWNAKVPEHLLRSMLDDPAPEVRENARLRLARIHGQPENA